MYKVTLFDGNTAPYISNTFSVYCDDIDEFEKNWSEMETDEMRKQRFRRSKQGEMATDYHSDAPELNIVQKDENAKTLIERTIIIRNQEVRLTNEYQHTASLFFEKGEFHIRYMKMWDQYISLVRYKLTGASRENIYIEGRQRVLCFGNPVLKVHNVFKGYSDNISDFSRNTVESIAYYLFEVFETEEEMKKRAMSPEQGYFSEEDLDMLLSDIPGESG
ncbi:MAG: hypothetical protein V8T31_06195 [Lachnospiraceae bacterium]